MLSEQGGPAMESEFITLTDASTRTPILVNPRQVRFVRSDPGTNHSALHFDNALVVVVSEPLIQISAKAASGGKV
jgi:hypothetical protein